METLVLNASYEPIQMVNWQRAMYYLFTEKAEVVSSYDKIVRSVSQVFQIPKIIKLVKYVKMKKMMRGVRYSRRNILTRDKMKCQYCGSKCTTKTATMDHVVPRSRGGKTSWENVVTACHDCNNKKDNRTPKEARMKLLSVPRKPSKIKMFEFTMPE